MARQEPKETFLLHRKPGISTQKRKDATAQKGEKTTISSLCFFFAPLRLPCAFALNSGFLAAY